MNCSAGKPIPKLKPPLTNERLYRHYHRPYQYNPRCGPQNPRVVGGFLPVFLFYARADPQAVRLQE